MKIQKINSNVQSNRKTNQKPNFAGAIKVQDTREVGYLVDLLVPSYNNGHKVSWAVKHAQETISFQFKDERLEQAVKKVLEAMNIPTLHLKKEKISSHEFDKFYEMDWDGITAEIERV